MVNWLTRFLYLIFFYVHEQEYVDEIGQKRADLMDDPYE